MAIAYVLALPIAWNREAHTRSAGLRTFPLVSIASCGFMLIAISAMPDTGSQARVVQGIITGIGFIGGGAILKGNNNVTGTATAASIWATAAIGISVALYRYEIAIVVSLLTFVTLQFLGKAK
ncbi:MAG: MgtC/SapB family protein, partial [Pseudomonadales bacterium]|nr:MgtC/SapB family protein [Pseudomonadales bacterium]